MTRTSAALVVVLTLSVVCGLVGTTGYLWAVTVGGAGVLVLAGVLQAQTLDRYRPAISVVTALALPVVGGTLLLGTGDVFSAQVRAAAPPGAVVFVGSVLLALFGAALTVRNPLGREPLVRALGVAVRVVLLLAGSVAVLATVEFTPLGGVFAAVASTAHPVVVDPPPGTVSLGPWLALIALALGGVAAALRALPVAELLVDADRRKRVERATRLLALSALPVAAVALVFIVLETTGNPYAGLGPGLRSAVAGLTGSAALRWLLVVLVVGSLLPAVVARFLKRGYRTDAHAALVSGGPYLGAAAVVAGTLLVSGGLVAEIRTGLVSRAPAPVRPSTQELAADVVGFYGVRLFALGVVLVVVTVTVVMLGVLTLAVLTSFLPEGAGGPALAGNGVFVASAFALVLGEPLWVGIAGAVAGLVVRDAGSFGTTLARELGDVPAARTELLHAGGSASVGAVTGVAALTVAWVASGLPAGSGPPTAALVVVVLGAALLVVASR